MSLSLEERLKRFRKVLEKTWNKQTSLFVGNFDPNFPSAGQCYVTAIVVQDLFGGEVIEGAVDCSTHFWNQLPNGKEYDLTSDQFKGGDGIHPLKRRTYWCTRSNVNRNNKRYLLLKKRIIETEDLNRTT